MITEFFYNNMAKVIIGILVFLVVIDFFIYKSNAPIASEWECVTAEYVYVTHRDGFWYCYDNDTVAWVSNFQLQEWKPATQFEKRRVEL